MPPDLGALHRSLAADLAIPRSRGWLPPTLSGLSHAPDVLTGRRVTGLDDAFWFLQSRGLLIREGGRWQVSQAGRRRTAHLLIRLPGTHRRCLQDLVDRWDRQRSAASALATAGRLTGQPRPTTNPSRSLRLDELVDVLAAAAEGMGGLLGVQDRARPRMAGAMRRRSIGSTPRAPARPSIAAALAGSSTERQAPGGTSVSSISRHQTNGAVRPAAVPPDA